MRAVLISAMLAAMAAPAVAQDLPFAPPSPMIDAIAAKAGKTPAFRTFSIGATKGEFETTELSVIQRTLGGKIEHQGDASSSEQWLCYDLPKSHQRLWLVSYEINGGEVADVTVWSVGSPANSARCPALSDERVSIDGFVAVDAVQTDIIKRLGAPGLTKADWSAWHREVPAGKGCEENDTLALMVRGGRIYNFSAYRTTSC